MTGELPQVSNAELEVLKVLWDAGASRVRDVLGALPEERWAYTTVQTLLHRLEDKGYVDRDKSSGVTVYTATLSRDEVLRRRLVDLSRSLGDGSALTLVHGIVDGHSLTTAEIDGLRALLDQLERKQPTKQTRRRTRGK